MKITHTPSLMEHITLADITKKKAELKQRIAIQKDKITATSAEIVSPFTHITSGSSFMNNFKTGVTLFNGIILGFKLIRKFRKYFHKK